MRTKDEPNVWRTLFTIAMIIIIFAVLYSYLYAPKSIEEKNTGEDAVNMYNTYITPYNQRVIDFRDIVLNNTKDLNTSTCITLFRYLRENITPVYGVDAKLPTETISMGSGTYLSLIFLYNSLLFSCDYNPIFVSDNSNPYTILVESNTVYILDFRYNDPIILNSITELINIPVSGYVIHNDFFDEVNNGYELFMVIKNEFNRKI